MRISSVAAAVSNGVENASVSACVTNKLHVSMVAMTLPTLGEDGE